MTPQQIVLIALIQALTKEVTLLEQELAQQQAIVATTTPLVFPTSTQVITATIPPVILQSPILGETPIVNVAPQPILMPSCNLVITPDNGNRVGLTWTSENESGSGTLYDNYKGMYNGGIPEFQVIEQYVAPSGTQIDLQSFTQAKLQFIDGTECSAQYSSPTYNVDGSIQHTN